VSANGTIPQKVKTSFKPVNNNVSAHVYAYFCRLLLAVCSHGSTLERLASLLRSRPYMCASVLAGCKGGYTSEHILHYLIVQFIN